MCDGGAGEVACNLEGHLSYKRNLQRRFYCTHSETTETETARPLLVVIMKGLTSVLIAYSYTCSCWPNESQNKGLEKLNRRIEHLSGLRADSSKGYSEGFMVIGIQKGSLMGHEIVDFMLLSVRQLWRRRVLLHPSRLSSSWNALALHARIDRQQSIHGHDCPTSTGSW